MYFCLLFVIVLDKKFYSEIPGTYIYINKTPDIKQHSLQGITFRVPQIYVISGFKITVELVFSADMFFSRLSVSRRIADFNFRGFPTSLYSLFFFYSDMYCKTDFFSRTCYFHG